MIQNEDGTWTLDEADPTLQRVMADIRRLIDTRDQERRHAAVFTTDNIGDPDNYVTAGMHNNPTYFGHHPEQHAHEEVWDAVVNQGSAHLGSAGIVATIAEVTPSAISIFIENAGDLSAITIASTDAAQRLQGKDADTTVLPVAVTCTKAGVILEQLGLTLAISGADTIKDCLLSGAGKIIGSAVRIEGLRVDVNNPAADPTELSISGAHRFIRDSYFYGSFVPGYIDGTMLRGLLADCFFQGFSGTAGYCVNFTTISDSAIIGNCFYSVLDGGLKIDNATRVSISGNIFDSGGYGLGMTAGTRLLSILSSVSSSQVTVQGNTFLGGVATDVLFECADAVKPLVANNSFKGGTILGSQDAMWIGNGMAGCTIDFQSKTGMVVIGGDMTGCTLQNIPSDIVFRNVKGQADRGDMLFVDALYDIGKAGATRPRDIFASRSIVSGQDIQIAGAMFASTAFGGFLNSLALLIAQPVTLGGEQFRLTAVATNDDPIESTYQNRVATTDATPTTLHTVAIPASKTVVIEADIIARRTGGAAGTAEDGASYKVIGTYKTVAGVPTVIALTALTGHESQAAWAGTLVVSGTNVLVQVTGAVNNNVTWHCTVKVRMVGT